MSMSYHSVEVGSSKRHSKQTDWAPHWLLWASVLRFMEKSV